MIMIDMRRWSIDDASKLLVFACKSAVVLTTKTEWEMERKKKQVVKLHCFIWKLDFICVCAPVGRGRKSGKFMACCVINSAEPSNFILWTLFPPVRLRNASSFQRMETFLLPRIRRWLSDSAIHLERVQLAFVWCVCERFYLIKNRMKKEEKRQAAKAHEKHLMIARISCDCAVSCNLVLSIWARPQYGWS